MRPAALAPPAAGAGPEELPLPVGAGPLRLVLRLRRFGPATARGDSVLLLHGANTSGESFLVPDGGLVGRLVARGVQAWVLEWRGSPHVVGALPRPWLGGSARAEIGCYGVDRVAREDIPAALAEIRRRIGPAARLSVLGHCVGGGALAIAAAEGRLAPFGVERIVLSTLGLFYAVPWSGWLKAEDHVLERVLHDAPGCGGVSPRRAAEADPRAWPWPRDMEVAYERWPSAWLPPDGPRGELFRRLDFMIGRPYAPERLHPSLHHGAVERIFGPLHLGLYLHVGQMVRRGHAAPFEAPASGAPARLTPVRPDRPAPPRPAPGRAHLAAEPFRRLRTTLLCAAANRVWHRDAMDLMHEWLRNNDAPSVKLVFPGYNIQELLWGARAAEEVYPAVLDALA